MSAKGQQQPLRSPHRGYPITAATQLHSAEPGLRTNHRRNHSPYSLSLSVFKCIWRLKSERFIFKSCYLSLIFRGCSMKISLIKGIVLKPTEKYGPRAWHHSVPQRTERMSEVFSRGQVPWKVSKSTSVVDCIEKAATTTHEEQVWKMFFVRNAHMNYVGNIQVVNTHPQCRNICTFWISVCTLESMYTGFPRRVHHFLA